MQIFRAAAAGSTRSELMMKSPTHGIATAITSATMMLKRSSIRKGFIPRVLAMETLSAERRNLLKKTNHIVTVAISTTARMYISLGEMLSISPIR